MMWINELVRIVCSQYMDWIPLIMFGAFLLIGALIILNSRWFKVRRALKITPEKPAHLVKEGEYVKVTGRICVLGEVITAPFSGRPCVYYCASAKRRNDEAYATIVKEEVMADVILYDGKNYVVIESDDPVSYLDEDAEGKPGLFYDMPPHFEEFMRRNGKEADSTLTFFEAVLQQDETVTATGYAEWRPASAFKFTLPCSHVLVLKSGKHDPVYFSDDASVISDRLFSGQQ